MRGSSYDKVDFCSLSSPSEQTYEKIDDKCMYMYFHWKLLDCHKTYWNKRKKYEYQNDFSVSLISILIKKCTITEQEYPFLFSI